MEMITIKEFKDKSNIEIIEEIMKKNNGYITSKQLSEFGIHRMYLNIMKEKGIIEKVGNGIYIDSSKIEDNYYVFSLSMPNAIISIPEFIHLNSFMYEPLMDISTITLKKIYEDTINLMNKHQV